MTHNEHGDRKLTEYRRPPQYVESKNKAEKTSIVFWMVIIAMAIIQPIMCLTLEALSRYLLQQ